MDLRICIAGSMISRMVGLLRKNICCDGEVLVITPCKSIHTIGMKEAIDVAFVGTHGLVQKSVRSLPPGKLMSCRSAVCVLERRSSHCESKSADQSCPENVGGSGGGSLAARSDDPRPWFAVGDSVVMGALKAVPSDRPVPSEKLKSSGKLEQSAPWLRDPGSTKDRK